MDITMKDDNDIKIVMFEGELDSNSAQQAESQLVQLLNSGVSKLVINFENLDFISSAGLRVLLATAKQLKVKNGALRICNLNETVNDVFEVSGFSSILKVLRSEVEAVGSF